MTLDKYIIYFKFEDLDQILQNNSYNLIKNSYNR
jgi:hypothetical protein